MLRLKSFQMKWVLLVVGILLITALGVSAQGNAKVAFVNTSGQLIVSSADGSYRWIVTNPGEALVRTLGFTWAPDGNKIFFAVNTGYEVSLRVGDVNSQQHIEIGRATDNGALSGGSWLPNSSAVIIGLGDRILYVDANGGGAAELISGQGSVAIISPYLNNRPNLSSGSSMSNDGRSLFYQQGDGRYAVAALDGSLALPLPGLNDTTAPLNALWAQNSPFVAFWGFEGNSVLSVTNTQNGMTVTLDSGRSAPITPLTWVMNTTLVYRDHNGLISAVNLACLASSCDANILATGVEIIPATATDVLSHNDVILYRDGTQINAIQSACIASANCLNSAIVVGTNSAPNTLIDVGGNSLLYTGYTSDPNNPIDRDVRWVDLSCVNGGSCAPSVILTGALSGLVSPRGDAAIVEQAGTGLSVLTFSTGALTYLSDYSGGQLLASARWAE